MCLADYQAEDKLQLIPVCGHTFHMDCIDLWLTSHTTCPLCRLTLIPTQSHQDQEEDNAPSSLSPDEGQSSHPQSHPVVNHENDGQEQQCDTNERDLDRESIKGMQEDEGNSVGTSDACRNCSTPG